MPAENFIDSNIFVYMLDTSAPAKRQRARELVYGLMDDRTGCISYQVVQESLNALIGKLGEPPDAVTAFLEEVLLPLWQINQINATPELYRSGLQVQARYGFSFYDSLIVAAALGAGCTTLYSEDMQDGQRIEGLTIRNPFAETLTE